MTRNVQLIITLFLVTFTGCVKTGASNLASFKTQFSSPPDNYDTLIDVEDPNLKQKLNGRCDGVDGPKSTEAFFKNTDQDLLRLERWSNENKFLFERAIVKLHENEIYISVNQHGCSHFGHSVEIHNNEDFKFRNIQSLLSYLNEINQMKLVTHAGRTLLGQTLSILNQKKMEDLLATKCSVMSTAINCTIYEDPSNIELVYAKRKINLNYWYVL